MTQSEKTEDGLEDLTEEQRRYVERLDAGEWTEPGPDARIGRVRVRKPLEKIVPMRLTDDQWQALTRAAESRGLRASSLLRMWLLEKLREIGA